MLKKPIKFWYLSIPYRYLTLVNLNHQLTVLCLSWEL
jgi:hypothetical protein